MPTRKELKGRKYEKKNSFHQGGRKEDNRIPPREEAGEMYSGGLMTPKDWRGWEAYGQRKISQLSPASENFRKEKGLNMSSCSAYVWKKEG